MKKEVDFQPGQASRGLQAMPGSRELPRRMSIRPAQCISNVNTINHIKPLKSTCFHCIVKPTNITL